MRSTFTWLYGAEAQRIAPLAGLPSSCKKSDAVLRELRRKYLLRGSIVLTHCVLPPVHIGQDLVYSGITENPPTQKPKKDRTLEQRGQSPEKRAAKKRTAFPLASTQKKDKGVFGGGFLLRQVKCRESVGVLSENFGEFSEQLSEFVIPCTKHKCHQAIQGKRGPKGQKKNLGREKVQCEKKGPEEAQKGPLPDTKVPGRSASGTQKSRQKPQKGASIAPAQDWAFPWESLLRGAGETTFAHFGKTTY